MRKTHETIAFIPEDDGITELERSFITNPTAGRTLLIVVRNTSKARMISTMMSIERAEQTDVAVLGDPKDKMAAAAIWRWIGDIPLVDIDITFAPPVIAAAVAGFKFMREGIRIEVTLGTGRLDVEPSRQINLPITVLDRNIAIRTDVIFRLVRAQRAMITASPIRAIGRGFRMKVSSSDNHRPRAPTDEELERGMFYGDRGCAVILKERASSEEERHRCTCYAASEEDLRSLIELNDAGERPLIPFPEDVVRFRYRDNPPYRYTLDGTLCRFYVPPLRERSDTAHLEPDEFPRRFDVRLREVDPWWLLTRRYPKEVASRGLTEGPYPGRRPPLTSRHLDRLRECYRLHCGCGIGMDRPGALEIAVELSSSGLGFARDFVAFATGYEPGSYAVRDTGRYRGRGPYKGPVYPLPDDDSIFFSAEWLMLCELERAGADVPISVYEPEGGPLSHANLFGADMARPGDVSYGGYRIHVSSEPGRAHQTEPLSIGEIKRVLRAVIDDFSFGRRPASSYREVLERPLQAVQVPEGLESDVRGICSLSDVNDIGRMYGREYMRRHGGSGNLLE